MPQDSTVFVERIERITEPTTVYDVTVKDSHNFFADGILVHNCPPPVQAAFLRVIAEKIVGDTPLPADTLVVTACNPSGIAANGFDLEPPMANRLYHHEWDFDWASWEEGMRKNLNFPAPQFQLLPDDWQKNLGSVGARITAFHQRHPKVFKDYPDKDRVKAAGAWPSPRSWTNACICAAAAEAIGGPPGLRYQVIEGCVGLAASQEFMKWEQSLDLADPEHVLAAGMAAVKAGRSLAFPLANPHDEGNGSIDYPNRPDKVLAMLGAVADRVVNHGATSQRWEGAASVFSAVAKRNPEYAIACLAPLVEEIPQGTKVSEDLLGGVIPLMQKVGMIDLGDG